VTLSERITELESRLSARMITANMLEAAGRLVPRELQQAITTQRQDLGWLRELRARRIAMGRVADDERNAAEDVCCCGPNLQRWRGLRELGYCPVHPRPVLSHDVPND
jgi:hypothetical protein